MSRRTLRSLPARLTIAAVCVLSLGPTIGVNPAAAAGSTVPTFGNPTISGIQGTGFEQDIRLDTHGRIYTSAPGTLASGTSYLYRSLDSGQTFKWVAGAIQPQGKLPTCVGGGDTELATDALDNLYVNDLTLANFSTARSSDQGRTFAASCAGVATAPDDRQWYAVDGNPTQGGSITLTYDVAPNPTPVPTPDCKVSNQLVFARSLPGAAAGLEFGPPKVLAADCHEGIMGNDEVHVYPNATRAFVIHDNDPLNEIRMARCDLVPFTASPTGYTNCVDTVISSFPNAITAANFPTLTIDRSGNLFTVWEQAPYDPATKMVVGNTVLKYAVSINQGDTWSTPRQLPTPGLNTNVFAWPAAGDSGRVDVAWYGTPAQAPTPGHGPDSVNGDWSLFMVQSLNFTSATPSWTPPILASQHFVHRGSIQTLIGGQNGDRTLGDFLQIRAGLYGEANISYADSNSDDEFVSQAAYVRQNGGTSLFVHPGSINGTPLRYNTVSVPAHAATFDTAGISSAPQPNLEILGSQMSMPNAATYQVKVQVADLRSLAPQPGAGGSTLVWDSQWKVPSTSDPNGGRYFHAYMESAAGGAPTFWVGENAVELNGGGATATYPGSTQVTGSYTPTAPGVITINIPTSAVSEANPLDNLLYSVTTSSMTLATSPETVPNLGGVGGVPFNLIDVAPAYDFNPALATPPFQGCHEADGDGTVSGRTSGTATFHLDKDGCEDQAAESVNEQDPASNTDFHSTNFTGVSFDDVAHTVTIVGNGTNAGQPVTFTMVGVDNGALPGVFSLTLSDGYAVSGALLSGSIQLQ